MHYSLNQLQIFLKVVENKSITKASEELHLSQPAVSIQLKNFQDQFEVPLIEVVGRKIYVTDFGREIAEGAEKIMEQVQQINFKTRAFKGKLDGRLKIAIVSTGKYVMPYFLSAFMQKNQAIALNMDVTNKAKVIQSLAANEVDFALVSILPKTPAVNSVELLQNKLYLVGSSQIKKIPFKQVPDLFENLPLIYREKGSGTRQTMEGFINRNKIPIYKKLELTSNEAVKQAVLAGLGFSIMPLIGIRNELEKGELEIIPIPDLPIITSWRLIWPKGKQHTPIAKPLLLYINQEKDRIVKKHFDWYEKY